MNGKSDCDVDIEIFFCHWCGDFNRRLWSAVVKKDLAANLKKGDAWDYGSKNFLMKECEDHKFSYAVLRCKKGGGWQVVKTWHPSDQPTF